ncbi:hypothetical protein DAPPUDRAFT_249077 [Daphnia pulex]|uniref:Uncharacterized protein n=1 Tax=Daphnia pulex TaxID=6669 RepID=E9GVT4_DAPPU|nr:hypothetical protein DAPPUDRAFT_249077 [Daphnia pulex]|eukprot:EFX76471.1 hypothetical protein DAPPUDRAFT_249077 [Daphnia pulex]
MVCGDLCYVTVAETGGLVRSPVTFRQRATSSVVDGVRLTSNFLLCHPSHNTLESSSIVLYMDSRCVSLGQSFDGLAGRPTVNEESNFQPNKTKASAPFLNSLMNMLERT